MKSETHSHNYSTQGQLTLGAFYVETILFDNEIYLHNETNLFEKNFIVIYRFVVPTIL